MTLQPLHMTLCLDLDWIIFLEIIRYGFSDLDSQSRRSFLLNLSLFLGQVILSKPSV